ncbi:MAG: nucleoside hydrolase [Pirellulaceae bacterium]
MSRLRLGIGLGVLMCAISAVRAADEVKITPDVVYGHKLGMALTFDVYTPPGTANGAGVLFMVSGGWYSQWGPPEKMMPLFKPMLDAGFTVFAVRHGSSPKFGIPEAVEDVRLSVRYIRTNAARFGVDPNRLGVCGMSAGGHLSLMLGTASDEGDAKADDPVLRASDRVQAVVAFVAPTDLRIMVWSAEGHLPAYETFPALELSVEEAAKVSPLLHVTPDDAPTLLLVGKKDELVPIKHSQDILAAFREKNVTSELMIFDDSAHGLVPKDMQQAMTALMAWFQKQLPVPAASAVDKIPIIYSTDLFQPHDDPDDHFDLATLLAMPEFEILGIIVEHGEKQATRPGQIPVRQMLQLTGRQVPCVVGLNPPLKSPTDAMLEQPAEYQQGVELILEKLRASDRKVTIFTTGSMRDVAAALNREPELMRQKVSRIYMNIGNALPKDSEYNVDLDPQAYVRIMKSGLPVYWCPCFGEPYGTYWKFRQGEVLETAPAGLQNFFSFALATGAEWQATPKLESVDPLAYLAGAVDPAVQRAVFAQERNMWCTALFFHAAGRQIVETAPGQWAAVPAGQRAEKVEHPFDFVPGKVTMDERARTTFHEEGQLGDPQIVATFKVLDASRYQAIMTSCLKELLKSKP